jgi:cytochrome o ubiquinol oxidase subunit 3
MANPEMAKHESFPDTHHDPYSKTVFGFWLFLLANFIFFGVFFAAYAVLENKTFGGPSVRELFELPFTVTQTVIFLAASLTSGLGGIMAHRKNRNWTIIWFLVTFFLGIGFLAIMLKDFSILLEVGNSWKSSAFLSGYFSLLWTHGVQVILALFWIPILLLPVFREGLTGVSIRRLTCLRMFWQFLNIIWIFIFTVVYLRGGS